MSKRLGSRRQGVSLTVIVTGMVIVIVALLLVAIQIPWTIFSTNSIEKLVEQINEGIIESINEEVEDALLNATQIQQIMHDLIYHRVATLDQELRQRDFYLRLLLVYPNISEIRLGFPNGDLYGARRIDVLQLRTFDNQWDPENQQSLRMVDIYANTKASGINLLERQTTTSNYYAPSQTWYRRALETEGHAITNVFVLDTSRKLATAIAIRLDDQEGNLLGVISVVIELNTLSSFIRELEITPNGAAFIVNSQRGLIAYRDIREINVISLESHGESESPQLNLLETSTDPILRIAHNARVANSLELPDIDIGTRLRHTTDDGTYLVSFQRVVGSPLINQLDWLVGTVIPEKDFLGDLTRTTVLLNAIIIAVVLVGLVIVLLITHRSIMKPVIQLSRSSAHIRDLNLDQVDLPHSFIHEIDQLSTSMQQMTQGLKSFSKYMPLELVQTLVRQGHEARLGSERRNMSILFNDITHFTRLSEQLGPDVVTHLTAYFHRMSDAIAEEKGTIDKYIGDAIMAFWGAPLPQDDHALRACRAAMHCQQMLQKMRRDLEKHGQELLYSRVGIESGQVLVGNFGWEQRMSYTVLGNPVNAANRLESLNKTYGTSILIGQNTYETVKDHVTCRKIDQVILYGKSDVEDVYELVSLEPPNGGFPWIGHFENGLRYYRVRQWQKAVQEFKLAYRAHNRQDLPSVLFVKRCQYLAQSNSLPDNWNGVFMTQQKYL